MAPPQTMKQLFSLSPSEQLRGICSQHIPPENKQTIGNKLHSVSWLPRPFSPFRTSEREQQRESSLRNQTLLINDGSLTASTVISQVAACSPSSACQSGRGDRYFALPPICLCESSSGGWWWMFPLAADQLLLLLLLLVCMCVCVKVVVMSKALIESNMFANDSAKIMSFLR